MAASEALLFKLEGAQQAAQLTGLQGKTFTVSKLANAGNPGLAKWMFLSPVDAAAASKGSVAIKIEGTRQVAQLSGLAGKTVTVGKTPATVGGMGKWLLLNTGKGAAVASTGAAAGTAAAATKGASASKMILVKAEGGRQMLDVSAMAGKSFTVMKPPMMGGTTKAANWMFLKPASGAGAAGEKIVAFKVQQGVGTKTAASMVGKSFTVAKAPMAAGIAAPQWLAFKPVAGGLATKGAAATATAVALNGTGAAPAAQNTIAQTAGTAAGKTGAGAGVAGKSATTAVKAAGGGTIWKGTGLSLGLGLGLGGWGPLLLVGAAAFGVGVYGYMQNNKGNEGLVGDDTAGGDMAELTLEG